MPILGAHRSGSRKLAAFGPPASASITAPWARITPTASSGIGFTHLFSTRRELQMEVNTGTIPGVDYKHLITVEPGKRSGKPCIRGMRITVYDVLEYLASDMTEDEILADFSELTRGDIKACLAFAADRERKLFNAAA
jgi:uncharacterized protein (DUF433 family)